MGRITPRAGSQLLMTMASMRDKMGSSFVGRPGESSRPRTEQLPFQRARGVFRLSRAQILLRGSGGARGLRGGSGDHPRSEEASRRGGDGTWIAIKLLGEFEDPRE